MPQMAIWRMHIACWITKATNAHSEYVILIAFPLKRWLQERASMLRYTYIACLIRTSFVGDVKHCYTSSNEINTVHDKHPVHILQEILSI
jgi:hypothetical protein